MKNSTYSFTPARRFSSPAAAAAVPAKIGCSALKNEPTQAKRLRGACLRIHADGRQPRGAAELRAAADCAPQKREKMYNVVGRNLGYFLF